jgi:hypothetical protein
MDKEIKSFKYRHGRKTYRMAWIVEFSLFSLGLALATFNLIFGLKEGDVISGTLLAIGWILLAIIELATIPLAGALRMASAKYIPVCLLGLLGLLFLSAFTVYEFNEISSEYMTRGARQASVKVEALKEDIMNIENEKSQIINSANFAAQKIQEIDTGKLDKIEEQESLYQAEKDRIDNYYSQLIQQAERAAEVSIFSPEEQTKVDRLRTDEGKTQGQIATYVAQLDSIRANEEENDRIRLERLDSELKQQTLDIDRQIEAINESADQDAANVTGFLKNSSRERIREDANQRIAELNGRKNEIMENYRSEIGSISSNVPAGFEAIQSKIHDAEQIITSITNQIADVDKVAYARTESPEFKQSMLGRQSELNRVFSDRETSLTAALRKHQSALDKIAVDYNSQRLSVINSAKSESDRIETLQKLNERIVSRANEIREIVRDTASKYEKTMYFRMASWFSNEDTTGFGKLPTKADYNKCLQYIFAPIGLFFGIAAITLAFVGTGFMYDAEESRYTPEDLIPKELKEKLEIEISELKSTLRKQSSLIKQNENLKKIIEKHEEALIEARQRTFEAVKRVPQNITIVGNENSESQA